MCIHVRSTSVCRHSRFNRGGITKHTAKQAKVLGTTASKKLEHDVHRKRTDGIKNSGNYKEARSNPDVSNRTRSNGHVGQGGVKTAEMLEGNGGKEKVK